MDVQHEPVAVPAREGAYDALYALPPPWDIGAAQPALREIVESGVVRGRVLDVGCGTGEHALMAAALGCAATGVDLSETALDQARRKAAERGLVVRFERRDVLELAEWGSGSTRCSTRWSFTRCMGSIDAVTWRACAQCSNPADDCSCSVTPRSRRAAGDRSTRSHQGTLNQRSPTAGVSMRSRRSPRRPRCRRFPRDCAGCAPP